MQVESKSPEPKKMRVGQGAVKFFPRSFVTPRPPFLVIPSDSRGIPSRKL